MSSGNRSEISQRGNVKMEQKNDMKRKLIVLQI